MSKELKKNKDRNLGDRSGYSTEIEELAQKYRLEPEIVANIIKKYKTIDVFIEMYRENKVSDEEINLFNDLIDIDFNPYNENYSKLVHAVFGEKRFFDEEIEVNDIQMYCSKIVDEVLHTLNPREEACLRERFGLDSGKGKTLKECGSILNVTTERVRQIEAKALRKLRHPSRSKHIRPISFKTLKESRFITDEERAVLSDIENEVWNSNLIFKHEEISENIDFDTTRLSIISDISKKLQERSKQSIERKKAEEVTQLREEARKMAIKHAESEVEKQFRLREFKAMAKTGDVITDDIDIDELDFSVRSYNCLRRTGINTLKDLYGITYDDLDKIRGINKKSIEEIISKLAEYGIRLEGQPELTTGEAKETTRVEEETLEDVQNAKAAAIAEAREKAMRDFEQKIKEPLDDMTVEEMDFSVRSFNCLKRAGIHTLGDLRRLTDEDLYRIRNLGRKGKEEVLSKLEVYNVKIESGTELTTDEAETGEKVGEIPDERVYSESENEENMYENLSLEELIEIAENSDPKSEQYINIQKMLIQKVKDQQNIIAEQQSTIDALQVKVNEKRRNQHDEQ